MPLAQRFKRLTVWNKTAFIGSLASIVALIPTFFGSLYQDEGIISREVERPTATETTASSGSDATLSADRSIVTKTYQAVIHESLPEFFFLVRTDNDGDDETFHTLRIEIRQQGDSTPFQIITPAAPADGGPIVASDEDHFFVIEDLNFDGFSDFRFMVDHAACCVAYRCYVYDTYRGTFKIDEQLTDIFERHSRIEILRSSHQIARYTHCPPGFEIKRLFQVDSFGFKAISAAAVNTEDGVETPLDLDVECGTMFDHL